MTPGIKEAFFWSAIERFGQQFMQFAISVVLARLLLPAEYGLIGMLSIFFALAGVFADAGFSAGLIQRRAITEDEETSVFCLNVAAGVLLTVLLCACSPLVAGFFRQPVLMPILCALSLQLTISSFGIVQYALLVRAVDFKAQALISMAAALVSGGVGIALAAAGCGVWSLVGQSLTRHLVNVALVWRLRPWRPRGRFRWAAIRALWPFSSRLLGSGLLNAAFDNVYPLLIGRLYRPTDLGYYTRAAGLSQLPAGLVQSTIGRVMFPILARMQDDKALLKERFRKTLRTLATFHFPVMAGLAAVATPLVQCLLTEKWLPCVPYLRILCFCGLLYPLHAMHLDVLTAQGRSDLFFRLEVIKKILVVVMVAITFRFGVLAMVWGSLVASGIDYFINGYYTRALIGYGWREQAGDLLPFLGASLAMGLAVWSLGHAALGAAPWLVLGVQVTAGVGIYGLWAFTARRGPFADVFAMVGRLLHGPLPLAGAEKQETGL